ncbi:MAG: hypothetical protein U0798_10485 [Gemmataceae bacterium]
MANLKLFRDECQDGFLPHRCMRCGAPTNETVTRTFTWSSPYWYLLLCVGIGIVIVLIIRLLLAKRMTVDVPLCRRHRHHWTKGSAIILFFIIADVAVLFIGGSMLDQQNRQSFDIFYLSFFALCLVSFVVIIITLIRQIRAVRIDDVTIELSGVNAEFKEEVKQLQKEADEAYREAQKRRSMNPSPAQQPIILDEPSPKPEPPKT